MQIKFISNSLEDTRKLALTIAGALFAGSVISLNGDLGAGKTTFTKSVAEGLDIDDHVSSPTFNILKCYFEAKVPLYHIDAYRLEEHNKDIGLEEYIEGNGIAVIEWPIYIKELLSVKHLEIKIINKGENKREITLIAPNKYYENIIRSVLKWITYC